MGHRASYAIRENGLVRMFYAHWGAMTIADWGPDGAEAFVRSNEESNKFLDNVFGEGGIVLDKDLRHATWFAWDWPQEPDVNRVYGELLAERWQQAGWTIGRVADWFALARAAGLGRSEVSAPAFAPAPARLTEIGANFREGICEAVLSVSGDEGWRDYAIDASTPAILIHGPSLLDSLGAFPSLETARPDRLRSFAAADLQSRTIRLDLSDSLEDLHGPESIPFLAEAWPGWRIDEAKGGIAAHFAFTGRSVPEHLIAAAPAAAPDRGEEECMRLIAERLAGTDDRKQFGVRAIGMVLGELSAESKVEVSRSAITPTPESGPVTSTGTPKRPKPWKN